MVGYVVDWHFVKFQVMKGTGGCRGCCHIFPGPKSCGRIAGSILDVGSEIVGTNFQWFFPFHLNLFFVFLIGHEELCNPTQPE